MKEKIYAPVIIPTLCRYEHFKRCIESLSRCTDAEKTELYIGLDYPTKDSHWEGYKQISEYVDSISGFKHVVVVRHPHNLGPFGNANAVRELVKKKYDRYICSEDDEEFSPNYLQYMNECLTKYKGNESVFAICGYNVPMCDYNERLGDYGNNAFPIHGYNAHASALWFDKTPSVVTKDQILKSFRLALKAIWTNHAIAVRNAITIRDKESQLPDIGRELYCVFNDKYCIFPRVSKVRNWGFDGSGVNCETISNWERMEIDTDQSFELDHFDIKDYPEIRKLEKQVYGFSKWYMNLYMTIDYIYFRLRGHRLIESQIVKKLRKKQ